MAAPIVLIDSEFNTEDKEFLSQKIKNLYFLHKNENLCEKINEIKPYVIIAKDAIEKIDSCQYENGWYVYLNPPKNIKRKNGVIVFTDPDNRNVFANKGYENVFLINNENYTKFIVEILKHFTYYTLEEPFRRYFTKDELLNIVIPKIAVRGNCAFIVNTKRHMYELNCYDGNVTIHDLDIETSNNSIETKEEFLEAIANDEFKAIECIEVDL